MHTDQLFDRLQFNDDLVFDEEIGPKPLVEKEFVISNRDRHLALDTEALFSEFMRKTDFVNGFEQSRSGPGVNLEGGVQDDFGQLIFAESVLRSCIHRPRTSGGPSHFASTHLNAGPED